MAISRSRSTSVLRSLSATTAVLAVVVAGQLLFGGRPSTAVGAAACSADTHWSAELERCVDDTHW